MFVLVFAVFGLLLGVASIGTGAGGKPHQLTTVAAQKIDSSIEVMRKTSTDPAVRTTGSISLISVNQMGTPEDADPTKRAVAKDILITEISPVSSSSLQKEMSTLANPLSSKSSFRA